MRTASDFADLEGTDTKTGKKTKIGKEIMVNCSFAGEKFIK